MAVVRNVGCLAYDGEKFLRYQTDNDSFSVLETPFSIDRISQIIVRLSVREAQYLDSSPFSRDLETEITGVAIVGGGREYTTLCSGPYQFVKHLKLNDLLEKKGWPPWASRQTPEPDLPGNYYYKTTGTNWSRLPTHSEQYNDAVDVFNLGDSDNQTINSILDSLGRPDLEWSETETSGLEAVRSWIPFPSHQQQYVYTSDRHPARLRVPAHRTRYLKTTSGESQQQAAVYGGGKKKSKKSKRKSKSKKRKRKSKSKKIKRRKSKRR